MCTECERQGKKLAAPLAIPSILPPPLQQETRKSYLAPPKTQNLRPQSTGKKKRIAHISIHQTSKVLTILYIVLGLLFIPIGVIIILSGQTVMGVIYVLMPFIYGIIGYPLAALMCWVYNMVAKSAGGIEFTVENEDDAV